MIALMERPQSLPGRIPVAGASLRPRIAREPLVCDLHIRVSAEMQEAVLDVMAPTETVGTFVRGAIRRELERRGEAYEHAVLPAARNAASAGYHVDFIRAAILLAQAMGCAKTAAAALGIPPETLRGWVRRAG